MQFRGSHGGASEQLVHVDPSTSNETRTVIDAGEHPNMGSAKAEFNDAQYVKDLRGAFSSVPKPRARWQDRYLKLMIVGETGQGDCHFYVLQDFFWCDTSKWRSAFPFYIIPCTMSKFAIELHV